MRKVMAHLFSSLDGFASDRDDEDMRWVMERQGPQHLTVGQQHVRSLGLLVLGRVTYEIMAGYWPNASEEEQPVAQPLNTKPKYVASTTLTEPLAWQNSTLLQGDLAEAVLALKQEDGGDLHVIGSSELVRSLLAHDLVDEFRGYRLVAATASTRWSTFG